MNNSNEHNELDQFLRESFEGHTIEPAEELWKGIEQRFSPQVVPLHKYSRLKFALYSSAVVIVGLVVMLFVLNTENSKNPVEAVSPAVEKPLKNNDIQTKEKVGKENGVLENSNFNLNEPTFAALNKPTENSEINVSTKNPNSQNEMAGLPPIEMGLLISKESSFPLSVQTKKLAATVFSPGSAKSAKPAESKKPSHNKKSNYSGKTKHVSAKEYYAHQSKSGGSAKPGNFINNFDLKLVASPSLTTRSLNNLQNVPAIEFDQKFFKETERPGFVLNGGIELAFQINKHWSLYSGGNVYNYFIHVKTGNGQYKIISQNEVAVPTSAGNVMINGEGVGSPANQSIYYTKLKLRYLDVPIVARFNLNQKFYFDAGLKYSYLFTDRTTVKRNDSDVKVEFDKITGLQKNNFGVVLGAGFEHITHSGIRFGVGPEITMNLTNMNPNAEVISKPIAIGFKASLFLRRYN